MTTAKTFEAIAEDEVGTVYVDRWEDGARFVVLRGPSALCAYLGVPPTHPIAGHSYDDLPVSAHGGLTYAGDQLKGLDGGLYWYGWDYAHAGDRSFYDLKYPEMISRVAGDHAWTPDKVDEDSWEAIYEFKSLMRLAEAIAKKPVPHA